MGDCVATVVDALALVSNATRLLHLTYYFSFSSCAASALLQNLSTITKIAVNKWSLGGNIRNTGTK
eukprot:7389259-Prymnesium_polylepis.1